MQLFSIYQSSDLVSTAFLDPNNSNPHSFFLSPYLLYFFIYLTNYILKIPRTDISYYPLFFLLFFGGGGFWDWEWGWLIVDTWFEIDVGFWG